MDKKEELTLFLDKIEELIASKYIIADVKIAGVLKAIASSETLMAIFKSCLMDFDYQAAQKKYLVRSKYLAEEKGEYVLPDSSKELLAFTFSVLVEIDSKRIDFSAFIDKYFYVNGSFTAGYSAFINSMIKPFSNTVKELAQSVIDGTIEDPVEALTKEEQRRANAEKQEERRRQKEKELSEKAYGESVRALRKMLLDDKTKINATAWKKDRKTDYILIIDAFANALESNDKDAVIYTYTAYKFAVSCKKLFFGNRLKKTAELVKEVINGL